MVCSSTVYWWYMLNCIIATTRPNSGMKAPRRPISFIRRSARTGSVLVEQQLHEDAVGIRVLTHRVVDQIQAPRDAAHGIGVH